MAKAAVPHREGNARTPRPPRPAPRSPRPQWPYRTAPPAAAASSFLRPPAGCLHRDTISQAPLPPPGRFPAASPPPDKSRRPRVRNPAVSSLSGRFPAASPRQTKAAARGPATPPASSPPGPHRPCRAVSRPKALRQTKAAAEGPQTHRQLSAGAAPPSPGRFPAASPPPAKSRRPRALKPSTRAAFPLFTSSPSCSPARWPPCRSGVRSPSRSPPPPQIPFRSPQPVPPGVPAGTVRRGAPAPFASPPGR